MSHAINHTCHPGFVNCRFVHAGIVGGRSEDEQGGIGGRLTSEVFVKTTRRLTRSVVKVGDQVLQPVPLGQVDWLGGPKHDHAMVGFRIAPLVLMHTRKYAPPARGRARIHLKDWQRMAPALQKELSGGAEAMGKEVRAGTVDVGTAVHNTLRNRHQLAQSWMAPTIRSRDHREQCRTVCELWNQVPVCWCVCVPFVSTD